MAENKTSQYKIWLDVLFVAIVSLLILIPLLNSGWIDSHEEATYLYRLSEFDSNIRAGILYPRWAPNFAGGYGYPFFNFYAPLVFYIGEVLLLIGFNLLAAIKGVVVIGTILASVSMYFLSKEFWGRVGGVFSAVVYGFAPYHLLDLYVRGDISEYFALGIFPLIFLFYYLYAASGKSLYLLLGSLFYALLILTHTVAALIFSPFIIIFTFWALFSNRRRISAFTWAIISYLLAYLLSAIYWLPALLEKKYVHIERLITDYFDYHNHFISWLQWIVPSWGFGISKVGTDDTISFQLGLLLIAVLITSIIYVAVKRKKANQSVVLILMLSLFSLFMTLEISAIIWENIGLISFVQFPWRFLMIAVFLLSFLAGFTMKLIAKVIDKYMGVVLVIGMIIAVMLSYSYITAKDYISFNQANFSEESIIATNYTYDDLKEYLPKEVPEVKEFPRQDLVTVTEGDGEISNAMYYGSTIKFDINNNSEVAVSLAHFHFRGRKAYLDGEEVKISVEKDGTMMLNLPEGNYQVYVPLVDTLSRFAGKILTLFGFIVLVVSLIFRKELDKKIKFEVISD